MSKNLNFIRKKMGISLIYAKQTDMSLLKMEGFTKELLEKLRD